MTDFATLVAIAGDRVMGTLEQGRGGSLRFRYEEGWRSDPEAFPLSLSIPLAASEHGHAAVDAFLWGLLPENERVLDRWARDFQTSARSAFALLSHVGEDCAGAVQFARPERASDLLVRKAGKVAWLTEREVAKRLRHLREDHAAWRDPHDVGQFSLAGAQPKTALHIDGDRIGIPSGRTPTTHILKPPLADFDGHAENEHFCLALARELGLAAAHSTVRRFDGEVAIVVERFDRVRISVPGTRGRRVERIHQEDCCQALGLPPSRKYQSERGPTPEDIVALLRAQSSRAVEDVDRFVDALILSWLIAGTDAHAKNYTLMLGFGHHTRLAPLYDLASALPYPQLEARRLKLAMKLGGSYRLHDIGLHHFRKLAKSLRLPEDRVLGRAMALAQSLPEAVATVRAQTRRDGLEHAILDRLTRLLTARGKHCAQQLRLG